MNDIPTISHNLHTQDNRITETPIFVVQQKRRIYGFEEGYTYDSVWVDQDGECADDKAAELEAADIAGEFPRNEDDEDYRRVWYRDEWVFVQPFFTEQGAKDYIAINGHNLREPRIYVESGYRNEEWRIVREHLMAFTTNPQTLSLV